MQINFALDKKLRDENYPFNTLKGKDVNTLVFPNLSSANSAYKLLLELGVVESCGRRMGGVAGRVHWGSGGCALFYWIRVSIASNVVFFNSTAFEASSK